MKKRPSSLSQTQSTPRFLSAVEDVAADKVFVVYGGEETYHLKPGIEAIGLKRLQQALLAREQGG